MALARRFSRLFESLIPRHLPDEMGWERVTPAQWREWENDTRFSFPLAQMDAEVHQRIVTTVLAAAERSADLTALLDLMRRVFGMRPHDAYRAVNRVLGGVVLAASGLEGPEAGVDPLGARAFTLAWADRPLVPAIRARWASWRPGGSWSEGSEW